MRTLLALAVGIGVVTAAEAAHADLSLDVSPIRVQVKLNAGDEYTNSIRVMNSGKDPVRLRAYVEDWTLDEIGTPIFKPAGTLRRSASLWLDAAPGDFLLEPGETKFVRFTAKVPAEILDGGYHGSLLLESLPLDRAEPGVMKMFIQGRVATMIYLSVGNPRRAAEITSLYPIQREGKQCLRLQIANTGDDFVRLSGEVKIGRGGDTPRDVVELPDVPVLPGSRRFVDLDLPGELTPDLLAQVTVNVTGVGVLLGECSLDPAHVQLVK